MKARDWALPAIIIAALVAAVVWYFRGSLFGPDAKPPVAAVAAPVAEAPPADTEPQNLVPEPETPAENAPKLPALGASDNDVRRSFIELFGATPYTALMEQQDMIRRFVAMVDNIPEPLMPMRIRSIRRVEGGFTVQRNADGTIVLSPRNAARYSSFVQALQLADMKRVAQAYFRFYPLFQSAYDELGHKGHYFNDRLVQVIDHLLATPDVSGPILMVQPKVFYEFADPQIEALSSGQKALIRMGPENAAAVKAKLRDLRAAVATHRKGDAAG